MLKVAAKFIVASAARYLRNVSRRREQTAAYMSALQMGDRRPVEAEEKYIIQWMDWGFSPEMVALAYEDRKSVV